jgi:hypothetical protein
MPGHFPAWKQTQLGGIVKQKKRGNVGEKWDISDAPELESSSPHSQQPATDLFPEPNEK